MCTVENIDFAAYASETLTIGYPVLGLVHQIAHLCRGDAGKYCHGGATTQDTTDSATILQIRASFDLIAKDLDRAIAATAKLARDHRTTPMPARSNLQQSVPITFGLKMARLLATLKRHPARLAEIRPRIEVVEFGGAAGTLATLGDNGLAVQEALAHELGLAQPEIAWHTERDRIAEAGCFLGLLSGTLAKFATDLKLMMQTEVGEAGELYIPTAALPRPCRRSATRSRAVISTPAPPRPAGGGGTPRRDGGGSRARHGAVGDRVDHTAGDLHAHRRRVGASLLRAGGPRGARRPGARQSRRDARTGRLGSSHDGAGAQDGPGQGARCPLRDYS